MRWVCVNSPPSKAYFYTAHSWGLGGECPFDVLVGHQLGNATAGANADAETQRGLQAPK